MTEQKSKGRYIVVDLWQHLLQRGETWLRWVVDTRTDEILGVQEKVRNQWIWVTEAWIFREIYEAMECNDLDESYDRSTSLPSWVRKMPNDKRKAPHPSEVRP